MISRILTVAVSLLVFAGIADLRASAGPASFDCTKDQSALAVTVCGDQATASLDRRTTASYLAVYFGLSDDRRSAFRNDHRQWLNGLAAQCSPSSSLQQADQPAPSLDCVRRLYTQRGHLYRKELSGAALEESNLSVASLKTIQRRLIDLKFLSGNVDGLFGEDTRSAIKKYQESIGHTQDDFLTAQERNMLLESVETSVQTTPSQQPAIGASDTLSQVPPVPSTDQALQSADNRQLKPNAPDHVVEQPAQQTAQEATSRPANADVKGQVDGKSGPQTQYLFVKGAVLAFVMLAFAAIFVFIRLRLRAKHAMEDTEFSSVDARRVVSSKVRLTATKL
jgi:hypothetical protein